MRKVLVIGSSGAGKSTFARRLGDITGIEVIHLDKHHWNPDWVETPKPEWRERVAKLIERDSWIMDGNYGGTMEMRLDACDTVIFLDIPRLQCTWRVIKRVVTYRAGVRPDMADGCHERVDIGFWWWVFNFSKRSKPAVEERLAKVANTKTIYRFTSTRAAERFLADIRTRTVA
jgi:adenylate kinase family enzyme